MGFMELGTLPKPGPALWALRELASTSGLPVLSESYYMLESWLDDPEATAFDVAGMIRQDPALAFNLIRYAARAGHRPRTNLWTLADDVGLPGVRAMLSECEVVRGYGLEGQVSARGLVDHAVNVALVAQLLAEAEGDDGELLYLAALLHDTGTMAMLRVAPDTISAAIQDPKGPFHSFIHTRTPTPVLDWSSMLLGTIGAHEALAEVLTAASFRSRRSGDRDANARLGRYLRQAHALCESHHGAFHWDRLPPASRGRGFDPERQTAPAEIPALPFIELH